MNTLPFIYVSDKLKQTNLWKLCEIQIDHICYVLTEISQTSSKTAFS